MGASRVTSQAKLGFALPEVDMLNPESTCGVPYTSTKPGQPSGENQLRQIAMRFSVCNEAKKVSESRQRSDSGHGSNFKEGDMISAQERG